ncbi:MAG: DUF1704 domain-containing protein [Candidatus Pacebacteria bacterium]|nr:DUF1704 domain-containing protein [Candidatus Paceibacterota bacterium]
MIKVRDLIPTNLQQEKAKFFAADFNYQPQLSYAKKIDTQQLAQQYGLPKQKYLDLAQEIIDRAYHDRNESEILKTFGKKISQPQAHQRIKDFLQVHGLAARFQIKWSADFLSMISINKNTIKLRQPFNLREQQLTGALYHEIGTHALRRVNYEQQPWYKKKKKHGFSNYLKTEEGLASLHSLIPRDFKLARKTALAYLAVQHAQQNSFTQLWQFLTPYIDDPDKRWIFAVRRKRGLTNTSQPGGFTKDILYLEGLVTVWQYLQKHQFNPTTLYFGKMALEDIEKAIAMKPTFRPKLPRFFQRNRVGYRERLVKIGTINQLDQLSLTVDN